MPAGDGRSLALASALLATRRGFLPQLEEIYQADLQAARHNLLLLGERAPGREFLADDVHREQSLQALCSRLLLFDRRASPEISPPE